MTPDERAKLIDTNSATWRAIKGWAEEQLADHRDRLEATMSDSEVGHHQTRGRIDELKALLALPIPPLITVDPPAVETLAHDY